MAEQAMKLSEAIRCGAAETEQAFGKFLNCDDGHVTCCALGAAAYCFGKDVPNLSCEIYYTIKEHVGVDLLDDIRVAHPIDEGSTGDLEGIIIELNDTHHWSREAIADWVESVGY